MGRPKLKPYCCPRCTYETPRKDYIRVHFTKLKKPCVAVNPITLTPDIIEYVYANRVYNLVAPPPPPPQTINNIINQNNYISNYIANMDVFTKLNQLLQYKNVELQDFESLVESTYEKEAHKFKKDLYRGDVQYDQNHFLEMIHKVTRAEKPNLSDLSVMYNKDEDRIYLSTGSGNWDNLQRDRGVEYIVDTIASYYLEYYEIYLIRKIESSKVTPVQKMALQTCLDEYYKFISTFKVSPFVRNKQDRDIFANDERSDEDDDDNQENIADVDSHRLVDKYNTLYQTASNATTDAQKKHILKSVVEVIKTSTKTNIRDLNKQIMSIIHMDEEFKTQVMQAMA